MYVCKKDNEAAIIKVPLYICMCVCVCVCVYQSLSVRVRVACSFLICMLCTNASYIVVWADGLRDSGTASYI